MFYSVRGYLFLLLGLGRFLTKLAISSLPTLTETSAAFRNLRGLPQGHVEGSKIVALHYTQLNLFLVIAPDSEGTPHC